MVPRLTLCIPTNGISEWVFPVLCSIYNNNYADEHKEEFEVVVTDNGDNKDFKAKMQAYVEKYPNLNYQETDSFMFNNQLEAFRLAKGTLIKFINHRTKLIPGSLKYFLDIEEKYRVDRPIINFTNGNKKIKDIKCDNFDAFVQNLGIMATWSAGISMWNEDFKKIPTDVETDQFFPHLALLFAVKNRGEYIIDNTKTLEEIPADVTQKGKYNLFEAFANRFPEIILDMVRSQDVSLDTFLSVKEESLKFCADLYAEYVIRKRPCSYSLEDKEKNLSVFYGRTEFKHAVHKALVKNIVKDSIRTLINRH